MVPRDPLASILDRQGVVILDGGLATELEGRGLDLSDDLWSARVLLERPEAIEALHLDYLEAGADCVVTSTYQASLQGFEARGLGRDDAEAAIRLSVRLALAARDGFWEKSPPDRLRPLVAASVGPYGAYLADGSEYRGDYDLDADGLEDFHRRRLELLASAGADLLACETLPSALEARVLARLLEEIEGPPAWFSFSCRNSRQVWDGTELAALGAELAASPRVVAVGVNCTAPRHVEGLVRRLAARTDKPIVVYPNSGEGYDAETGRWRPADRRLDLATQAPRWVGLGARLVGGCCRTTPEDVRRIRAALIDRS